MKEARVPVGRLISDYFREEHGRADVISVESLNIGQRRLTVVFEHAKPDKRRGLWLGLNGTVTVAGQAAPSVDLWVDTAPPRVEIEIESPVSVVSFYPIAAQPPDYQRFSLGWQDGMLAEEVAGGMRYRCRASGDEGFEFDGLTFRLEFENPEVVRVIEMEKGA